MRAWPPTIGDLRAVLRYEDGALYWAGSHPFAGRPVYTRKASNSAHRNIRFRGKNIYAHRVIWAVCHGKWPEQVIDHINRDPSDNRIENLRDVSVAENNRNSSRGTRRGRLGARREFPGGWVEKSGDCWCAGIQRGSFRAYLGTYATRDEAEAAREAAARVLEKLADRSPTFRAAES